MQTQQVEAYARRTGAGHSRLSELGEVLDAGVRGSGTAWVGEDAASGPDSAAFATGRGDVDDAAPTGSGRPPGVMSRDPDEVADVDPTVAAAWRDMSEDQKVQVLQELVNRELEAAGMEPIRVVKGDLKGSLGAFDPRGLLPDVIYVDTGHLDDPDVLNTALHEARHAIQQEMVRRTERDWWDLITGRDTRDADYREVEREYGITREEIEAWRSEQGSAYVEPPEPPDEETGTPEEWAQFEKDWEAYASQAVEQDASDAGVEGAEALTLEDLQDLQRSAGVPVTSG